MGLLYTKPTITLGHETISQRTTSVSGDAMSPHSAACRVLRSGSRASRFSLYLAVAGFAVSGFLAPAVVRADTDVNSGSDYQSAVTGDTIVELDVTNANMLAVVELLRKPGGTQFIISGDTKLFHPVTVHLKAPLSKMLEYVAQSAGATISKDEYGVYTIRPTDPNSPVPSAVPRVSTGDTPSSPSQSVPDAQPPASVGPERWETINLQYVEPTFILSVLNAPDRPVASPYGTEFRPQPIHVGSDPTPQLVMTDPFSNGNKASSNNQPANGSSTQPGVPLSNGSSFISGADRAETRLGVDAQQFPVPGAAPGGGGNGAAGGKGVDLRPAGVDQIIAITEQNTLLVRGTSEGIAELRDIIAKLDVPAKQVQIKVEFVTASVNAIDQLGISFDLIPYPSVETGFFPPGPSGSGSTFLTYAHGNLVAQLAALLQSGTSNVIASPMITLTNNIPGSITVTDQIPYSQTTTIAQGSGNALQAQTTSFLNVPTGLTARARINGDNSVTLQLTPQLSTIGTASGTGPPPVSSQTVQTIRTVGNGETMVLGGLVQKTDGNSRYSYPILSDLPIIGSLFRSRNNTVSDTELLLFVTPTILPVPGSTTTGETVAPIQEGVGGVVVGGVTP